MQFVSLIAIVSQELEEEAIEIAKQAGAGSVTLLQGRNQGLREKKIFFGLTFEENVSVLIFILPKKICMDVFKALRNKLELDNKEKAKGTLLSMPITHLTGIDEEELRIFEDKVMQNL